MNKTDIDCCDYSLNPVKGLCPVACPYCSARAMYKRFHWNETIRYQLMAWYTPINPGKVAPGRIFVGSTIELFGPWVDPSWMERIMAGVKAYPQHTFIFLTKRPQELAKYNPWPDNCWVGASATDPPQIRGAFKGLSQVRGKVKFISFEPLLGRISPLHEFWFRHSGVNWVIIGLKTPPSKRTTPPKEWVDTLILEADQAHIPVFLKDSLYRAYPDLPRRQEFPQ